MGARSLCGPLPESATNLWLAVHSHPLESAIGISLDLDISVIFRDIIPSFRRTVGLPWARNPLSNLWLALPAWGSAPKSNFFERIEIPLSRHFQRDPSQNWHTYKRRRCLKTLKTVL